MDEGNFLPFDFFLFFIVIIFILITGFLQRAAGGTEERFPQLLPGPSSLSREAGLIYSCSSQHSVESRNSLDGI